MAQVCDPGSDVFNRLQRRIDAAERTYHRTLLALQKIESRAPQPGPPSEPEPLLNQPSAPEIGFVPSIPPQPPSFAPSPATPALGPASEASPASSTPFVLT